MKAWKDLTPLTQTPYLMTEHDAEGEGMSDQFTSEGYVTIYDRKTKQSRTFHWGPGHSIEFWWQEGNGSCDCNRHLYFWNWKFPIEEEDRMEECSHARYIITHIDKEEVDFHEWNSGYEKELA